MAKYNFALNRQATPQTQPIPGRETEMVKGRSGAVTFDAGLWTLLDRCLILGTANGSYYANARELSQDFIDTVQRAAQENPDRTAEAILAASDGKAIRNDAPIFALALLGKADSLAAKRAAARIFPQVVRTGSHFHEWSSYQLQLGKSGRLVRRLRRQWLLARELRDLTYQCLKYRDRSGISFRDELRLAKPNPGEDAERSLLFGYLTRGWDSLPAQSFVAEHPALAQIWWYEWLKRHPDQPEIAIEQGRLTQEMVRSIAQMTPRAWQLLFEQMPLGATLRQLSTLTREGVLRADAPRHLDLLEARLTDRDRLRRARVHPIAMLAQAKAYAAGQGKRSEWQPVPRVSDILERGVVEAFEALEPTGKVFLHAVDVSGSMSWGSPCQGLTCAEVAAAMALATAKAERNYAIHGFSTKFVDLKITARDSFSSALAKTQRQNFGATDASVAYDWAIAKKFRADVFCFWTDGESWAGRYHPAQALANYRRRVNPEAKAVYTSLAVNRLSLVDPQDPNSWDIAGFAPDTPKVVQAIAAGL